MNFVPWLDICVFMKTILDLAIPFEKEEYREKLVASRTVDIMKDMIGFDVLKGMSVQSYYQYIGVA